MFEQSKHDRLIFKSFPHLLRYSKNPVTYISLFSVIKNATPKHKALKHCEVASDRAAAATVHRTATE